MKSTYRGTDFSCGLRLRYGLARHCREVLILLVYLEDGFTTLDLAGVFMFAPHRLLSSAVLPSFLGSSRAGLEMVPSWLLEQPPWS